MNTFILLIFLTTKIEENITKWCRIGFKQNVGLDPNNVGTDPSDARLDPSDVGSDPMMWDRIEAMWDRIPSLKPCLDRFQLWQDWIPSSMKVYLL